MTNTESITLKFIRGELDKSQKVFFGKTYSGKEVAMRVVIDSLRSEDKGVLFNE